MTINSKYFDSIRIRSGKKTVTVQDPPKCYWAGCDKIGQHRAPAGYGREGQYFHFCMTHVREYNKNFNYFDRLSDNKIKNFQKDALTDRQTWRSYTSEHHPSRVAHQFSTLRSGSATYQNRSLRHAFDAINKYEPVEKRRQRKIRTLEARAFSHLGLQETASGAEIRAQYKALVKLHHPDSNGGDRSKEDRLREVLHAYNLLKQGGFC